MLPYHTRRLVLPNMSLYYSFHFRGQSCRLSGKFFQKLFQTSQAGIDRASNSALMGALRFCNIRFAHAKKIVRINPLALLYRKFGKTFINYLTLIICGKAAPSIA